MSDADRVELKPLERLHVIGDLFNVFHILAAARAGEAPLKKVFAVPLDGERKVVVMDGAAYQKLVDYVNLLQKQVAAYEACTGTPAGDADGVTGD